VREEENHFQRSNVPNELSAKRKENASAQAQRNAAMEQEM